MSCVTLRQLGQHLAHLRKRAGLSQAQVAAHVGVTMETISRVERGVQWTDLAVLTGMADAFGVSWRELVAVAEGSDQCPHDAVIREIVSLLSGRPLSDVEFVRDMVAVILQHERKPGAMARGRQPNE
ncbi:MAG: helix-turn-helix transcriptional regulator [Myxococcota bacterium]